MTKTETHVNHIENLLTLSAPDVSMLDGLYITANERDSLTAAIEALRACAKIRELVTRRPDHFTDEMLNEIEELLPK